MSPEDLDRINPRDVEKLLRSSIWTDAESRSVDLGATGRIDISNLAGAFAYAAAVSGIDLPPGVDFPSVQDAREHLKQALEKLLREIQRDDVTP
jgi:hypothetical protein